MAQASDVLSLLALRLALRLALQPMMMAQARGVLLLLALLARTAGGIERPAALLVALLALLARTAGGIVALLVNQ